MKFCFIVIVFIYMLFIVDLLIDLPDNEVLYLYVIFIATVKPVF